MIDPEKAIEPPGVADGLTHEERVDEFLRLLSQGCTVRQAAAAVAINYSTFYRMRKADPAFAKRWEDATRVSVDHLVREAERRAMSGSDKLLVFLLSSYDPARFKNRSTVEHEGGVQIKVITGVPDSPVDDLL